ncbi:helix-turn-helix domain-containing protein [Effusibacillus pohliae]|uniref:helix-turn-helix domain-containing protein n=1 Tax=Effusibacillus pohliae TaxID=232270 RepID=UPI00035F796B|nr:helix-turn-helix transcriptional regulator [Effusibacillus pohliae]
MKVDLQKIKRLRIENNLSLEDMAAYLGYKTATGYYYAESGRCKFKPHHIPMIANKFEIPMEQLFCEDEFAKMAKDEQSASTA